MMIVGYIFHPWVNLMKEMDVQPRGLADDLTITAIGEDHEKGHAGWHHLLAGEIANKDALGNGQADLDVEKGQSAHGVQHIQDALTFHAGKQKACEEMI